MSLSIENVQFVSSRFWPDVDEHVMAWFTLGGDGHQRHHRCLYSESKRTVYIGDDAYMPHLLEWIQEILPVRFDALTTQRARSGWVNTTYTYELPGTDQEFAAWEFNGVARVDGVDLEFRTEQPIQLRLDAYNQPKLNRDTGLFHCSDTLAGDAAEFTHWITSPGGLDIVRSRGWTEQPGDMEIIINAFVGHSPRALDKKGIARIMSRKGIRENMARLEADAPILWNFLCWLSSSRVENKVSNNQLLAAFIEECGSDWDRLTGALNDAILPETFRAVAQEAPTWMGWNKPRAFIIGLPGVVAAHEKRLGKALWALRRTNGDVCDALGIDAGRYPLLRDAVEIGQISSLLFKNPDGSPTNRSFGFLERALERGDTWRGPLVKIVENAAARKTYTRRITPYLAFCLDLLPEYLEKHTGRKWECVPSFVSSTWQLEMDDGETVRKRCALTPVVSREPTEQLPGVVTVPYVGLAVHGRRTQWCYSDEYHLYTRGFIDPFSKTVVPDDLERKLNGRDDYGFMFYTLTGTSTARGYPAFLVIFEQLERVEQGHTTSYLDKVPRVHFHRVHPSRSDPEGKTPASDMIRRVYKYMTGGVSADDVAAQQGDMIYTPCSDPRGVRKIGPEQASPGIVFESHHMESINGEPILMFDAVTRTPWNRLGYLLVPSGGMRISHPEHDDIEYLAPGWYIVMRCRSWGANPKAIMSVIID